jgi:type I restriction enzyme S subunit
MSKVNENRKGYQETRLGWIPDHWEMKCFDELTEITRLAGYEYSEYWEEDPNKEIIALRGYNIGNGKLSLENLAYISNRLSLQLKRSKLNKGDIVYPCVGTIGNACVIEIDDKFHIQQNIAKISCKENSDPYFIVQFLISSYSQKEVVRFNATSSQPNVLVGSLRKYRIALPPIKEQKTIAKILTTWDKAIEKQEQLIAKKEALKKGLMQQLLTGKKRFPGFTDKWKEVKLGAVLKVGSGKDYKHLGNGDIPVYGSGGHMLSVDKYLYDGESVGIGRKGTIDKPIFLTGKFWTVDTLFYTHSFKRCSPRFIYYLFLTINWRLYNEASGVPSLSKTTIEKINVKIPKQEEQLRIESVLTRIDSGIDRLKNKLEALKQQKKGLMQKLLTGEIRVKI